MSGESGNSAAIAAVAKKMKANLAVCFFLPCLLLPTQIPARLH